MKMYEEGSAFMYRRNMVLTVLAVLFLVVVAGCGGSMDEFGNVTFPSDTPPAILSSPTFAVSVTPSVVPTATVDYAATAVVAQATADEARRVNAEATAQHERIVQEQLLLTSEAERRVFEQAGWTVTAAGTAIPLTQTQQAVLNTQIAAHQTLAVVQITQTVEAPQLLIEMQVAEDFVQYAPLRVAGEAFVKFALGVVLIFVAAWFRTQPQWNKKVADKMLEDYLKEEGHGQAGTGGEAGSSSQHETVVVVKNDNGQGHFSQRRLVIPCSPDQLTELANGLMSGKSLGINQWEGSGTSLTRDVITGLRHFFLSNRLATSIGAGRVAVNDDGLAFCRGWVEQGLLPTSFQFVSNGNGNHGNMAHEHEKSYDSHDVGEAVTNE